MILCPSDFSAFELGTLVIGIYSFPSGNIAQGVGAKVTVTVTVHGKLRLPHTNWYWSVCRHSSGYHCTALHSWARKPYVHRWRWVGLRDNDTNQELRDGLAQRMHDRFVLDWHWNVHVSAFEYLGWVLTFNFSGFSYDPFPELKFESKLFTGGMETGGTIQKGAFVICPQVRTNNS